MFRFATACLVLTFSFAVTLQQNKKLQEPEYIGVFFFLDTTTDSLTPLERQRPEVKAKAKSLGLRGAESSLEIKGGKSPTRFNTDQPLSFVVRAASQQIDPNSYLEFFSLESKGGKRTLVMAKAGLTSGETVSNKRAIAFNVEKYGEFSFKISPAQRLLPGEYVLTGKDIYDGFCFGVDPSQNQK